jgi:hypothetical protein
VRASTARLAGEFLAALHYGPGPHPDGSPQSVHGGGAVKPPAPPKREWLRVKFYWPTYDPTEAFSSTSMEDVRVEGKSLDGGRVWLPLKGAGKLEQVRDWMMLNGLSVTGYDLLSSKRIAGRWHGLFSVTIGERVPRAARLATIRLAGEFTAALHYGPGPHPDGSPQSVHAGGAEPARPPRPTAGQTAFDFDNPPVEEEPRKWPPDGKADLANIDPATGKANVAKIGRAIAKAVQERPERMVHGNTGYTGFWLVRDRAYVYNDYNAIPAADRPYAMAVHSHTGVDWREGGTTDPDETALNSGDIHIWLQGFKAGKVGPIEALITADGRLDVLQITDNVNPAIFGMSEKRLEKELHRTYAEHSTAAATARAAGKNYNTAEAERNILRAWAKDNGLAYFETRWRQPGERMPDIDMDVIWHPRRKARA